MASGIISSALLRYTCIVISLISNNINYILCVCIYTQWFPNASRRVENRINVHLSRITSGETEAKVLQLSQLCYYAYFLLEGQGCPLEGFWRLVSPSCVLHGCVRIPYLWSAVTFRFPQTQKKLLIRNKRYLHRTRMTPECPMSLQEPLRRQLCPLVRNPLGSDDAMIK